MSLRTPILITSLMLALGVTACQSAATRNEHLAYVERPVERIYNLALAELDKGDYAESVALFNEVERQHPYSEWARRSALMSAFASYQARDYDQSIATAQRFISLNPAADDAAYAYYLIAVSYFDQIVDVGRDQNTTELSKAALTDVARRFPDSDYARDANLKLDMVQDQLAGKEMEIGRWYLRRNQHLAAVNRFKTVVKDYETTGHAAEALHRLVETYLSLGLRQDALAAGAVLGYNYPDSDWYQMSYRLLSGEGMDPSVVDEAQKRTWLQRLIPGGR
mgnify:CR=1 FL=1